MRWLLLLFPVITGLVSCNRSESKPLPNADSIRSVSLSKQLKAVDFEDYYTNKYSVQFDSLLFKRVFTSDYKVKDVKKDSIGFTAIISIGVRYTLKLKSPFSDTSVINGLVNNKHPVLVFVLDKISKQSYDYAHFFGTGMILETKQ